ncbi:unnamed protein product [Effrenium voratum]|nr:unnamed protein product [Effrenium voratum]
MIWLLLIGLAGGSPSPSPSPILRKLDEPCSQSSFLVMIRDYAPTCISACPQICLPLEGLITNVMMGGDPYDTICPGWQTFDCMARPDVLADCTPLLDAALYYMGINLPRSGEELHEACHVTTAEPEPEGVAQTETTAPGTGQDMQAASASNTSETTSPETSQTTSQSTTVTTVTVTTITVTTVTNTTTSVTTTSSFDNSLASADLETSVTRGSTTAAWVGSTTLSTTVAPTTTTSSTSQAVPLNQTESTSFGSNAFVVDAALQSAFPFALLAALTCAWNP